MFVLKSNQLVVMLNVIIPNVVAPVSEYFNSGELNFFEKGRNLNLNVSPRVLKHQFFSSTLSIIASGGGHKGIKL